MIDRLRFAYHVGRNLRRAARDAMLTHEYAEFRSQVRAGRVLYGTGSYGWPKVMTFELGTERLIVGKYSSLGGTYLLGGMHGVDRVSTYPFRINWQMDGAGEDGIPIPTGDTIVGSDCWTCMGCWILGGVHIGHGAIVAAGSVVTRDVPPYAVVGGNPARLIRYRFDEEQIAALLQIRWWDWPRDRIRAAVPLLSDANVDAFIDYALAGGMSDQPVGGRECGIRLE